MSVERVCALCCGELEGIDVELFWTGAGLYDYENKISASTSTPTSTFRQFLWTG